MYADLRIEPEDTRRQLDSTRIASGTQLIDTDHSGGPSNHRDRYDPRSTASMKKVRMGPRPRIGWQRLSTRLAPIEAVEGRIPSEDPKKEDLGLLITLEGEIVSGFTQSKVTTDTIRRHWISLDRTRERWSVQRTPRRIISSGPGGLNRKWETPRRKQASERPLSHDPPSQSSTQKAFDRPSMSPSHPFHT